MSEDKKIIKSICKNCFELKNCYYVFFEIESVCPIILKKLSEYDEYQTKVTGKLFKEEVKV